MPSKVRLKIPFWISLSLIIGLRIWFVNYMDKTVGSDNLYDDGYFLNMAWHFTRGESLGPYNLLTFIKGTFYSLFIAINHFVGLNLMLSEHLLYLVAMMILFFQLNKLNLNKGVLLFTFFLACFLPYSSSDSVLRVMRSYFYGGLTILLVALAMYHFMEFRKVVTQIFKKSCTKIPRPPIKMIVVFSAVFAGFELTREEGVWIYPVLFVFFIAMVGHVILTAKMHSKLNKKDTDLLRSFKYFALILFVAITSYQGFIHLWKIHNYARYKLYMTNEFKSDYFISAYSSLTRIKDQNFRRYVRVSKDVREKLYQTIPSFGELRPYLDGPNQSYAPCDNLSSCDDHSTHFTWIFRDAVARAGYYSDPLKTKSYYERLSSEIDSACNKGTLSCNTKIKTYAPLYRKEYNTLLWAKIKEGLQMVANLDYLKQPFVFPDYGHKDSIRRARFTINSPKKYDQTRYQYRLKLSDPGQSKSYMISFKTGGKEEHFNNFDNNGILLDELNCQWYCSITILKDGKVIKNYPDLNGIFPMIKEKFNGIEFEIRPLYLGKLYKFKVKVLQKIALIYSKIFPYMVYSSFFVMLVWFISLFFEFQVAPLPVLGFACFLGAFGRILLLSYLDISVHYGLNTLYLGPVYGLTFFFTLSFMTYAGVQVKKYIVRKTGHSIPYNDEFTGTALTTDTRS